MAKTLTKFLKRGGHPLSFEDKTLQCSDCGQDFTFTAGEQEFYASRGFQNEPKRCPDCRKSRKANVTAIVDTVVAAAAGTERQERCSRLYAPNVELRPKYLSSPVRIDLFIAATATIKLKPTN